MSRNWNEDRARTRINTRLAEVDTVEIRDYVRDVDLENLANGVAYRVDGVHLYVDILNMSEMLSVTAHEGTTAHRRTLRFLNLHFRAVTRILVDVDAIHVDFHNQRLHAVFPKPYDDEQARIHTAIATGQLIADVLSQIGEDGDDPMPPARVRVGIDSGVALAVNNGRRGNREPLFLGCPANLAAKLAGAGDATGIFATNKVREAVGWTQVGDPKTVQLTRQQIDVSEDDADLHVTADSVVEEWLDEQVDHPIRNFEFSRHTPPFRNLNIELLTDSNSRRQEAVSIYADIDGFTNYVATRADSDEGATEAVVALHALRSELDAVLHEDFAGRKMRFIGDCVHGALVEGTAATTDEEETARVALLCAAAMRSSFELALEALADNGVDASELGLGIGLELGPLAITRLGVKGERIRCCVGRAVIASEEEQLRCDGEQTAIGPLLAAAAPKWLRDLIGAQRRCSGFVYDVVVEAEGEAQVAKSAAGRSLLRPATAAAAAAGFEFPNRPASPSKTPAGFA